MQEEVTKTKFHAFLTRRKNKANFALQEAQKLVNLYRILNNLGENFVDEYNTLLLNASDEVLMALTAIVGGKEVRQYFDFLTLEKKNTMETDEAPSSNQNIGWLPSPEDQAKQNQTNSISTEEWNAFVQAEDEKITELVSALRQEQSDALKHLTDQLNTTLAMRTNLQPKTQTTTPQYSEIIEDTTRGLP